MTREDEAGSRRADDYEYDLAHEVQEATGAGKPGTPAPQQAPPEREVLSQPRNAHQRRHSFGRISSSKICCRRSSGRWQATRCPVAGTACASSGRLVLDWPPVSSA